MTNDEAIDFVKQNGIVLEAARGPYPNLAEVIAGSPIRGSWWGHSKAPEIFRVTRAVRRSDDILVCRLVNEKVTYVHRRLWPALVRLADRIGAAGLAAIKETHTPRGRHVVETVAFPGWVPPEVKEAAARLDTAAAEAELGNYVLASADSIEGG